jgi:hypothetical protein
VVLKTTVSDSKGNTIIEGKATVLKYEK